MGSVIIQNGLIMTMDKERTIIPNGVLEIRDDRIAYIGEQPYRADDEASATIIDAKGKAVMPGLINGHTHLHMTFSRTIGFELNLMDWLNKSLFPLLDEMGEHDLYLATMIGSLENLKNGNTTVVNNVCSTHKNGACADMASVRAFKDTGLRECLALCYVDQNHYKSAIEKPEQIVARCEEMIREYHNTENGRLKILIGPEFPWGCSKMMFRETVRLSEEFGVGLNMHAHDNTNWNAKGEEAHGMPTNLKILREYGCLGPRTSLACMRLVSDDDIANLVETGTGVIFDPTTALNWGTGLPPIPKVLRAGIRIGLGTNGSASNFGQDMFEAMKNAIGMAKTFDGSPDALPILTALEMVTIRNAELLGINDQVGSLEVGKKADIITVNLNRFQCSPCLNVMAAIVLSTSGRDVEDVIVDGKILIKNGKLVDMDEAALIQEATERALFCAKKARLDHRLLPLNG
jgi:5-methylthioadenosine/S-adenosylhomocysteine deaminase